MARYDRTQVSAVVPCGHTMPQKFVREARNLQKVYRASVRLGTSTGDRTVRPYRDTGSGPN